MIEACRRALLETNLRLKDASCIPIFPKRARPPRCPHPSFHPYLAVAGRREMNELFPLDFLSFLLCTVPPIFSPLKDILLSGERAYSNFFRHNGTRQALETTFTIPAAPLPSHQIGPMRQCHHRHQHPLLFHLSSKG